MPPGQSWRMSPSGMYGVRLLVWFLLKYRIAPNFRGVKFSRMANLKHFMEQFLRMTDHSIASAVRRKFRVRNFRGWKPNLENRKNCVPRKFGAIRYWWHLA